MQAAIAEMPLALFTTFASIGAGAFLALVVAFFAGTFSDDQLKKIDKLTIIPFLVVVIGFIAAVFHLASPMNAFGVFAGVGSSPLSNELVCGVIFAVLALIYTVLALAGKLSGGVRRGLGAIVAVVAIIFAIMMGAAYMMDTIISWNTPLIPVQMLGYLFVGGAALGSYVIAQAGAGDALRSGSVKGALGAVAIVGAVLALIGLGGQIAMVSGMGNALYVGADLVDAVMPLALGGLALVVVSAALTFVGVRAKSPATMLAVATLAAIVGILLARLAFYGMQLSVGLSAL